MSDSSNAGAPSTIIFVFDVVKIAEPPCMQSTVLAIVRTLPGIAYITLIALLLTSVPDGESFI